MSAPKKIVIYGSTGSIGKSTLDIVRQHPERFEVFGLVAHTNTVELQKQIAEFHPRYAVLTGDVSKQPLQGAKIVLGEDAALDLAGHPDVTDVVAAIVGLAGLRSVVRALESGKRVLLANKESLVCAGKVLCELTRKRGATLLPIDSEHSAIFQLLDGARSEELSKLVLTASGGPFLRKPIGEFERITPEEAVRHPKWSMGPKISVDSATLVNKGLELIEAHFLFRVESNALDVAIHPESIIHALVYWKDGAVFSHLSNPDMRGPISYALSYPTGRIPDMIEQLDLIRAGSLSFLPVDEERFPAVRTAKQCITEGRAAPAVFSIANEIAVHRFLQKRMRFTEIVPFILSALDRFGGRDYSSVDDIFDLSNEIDVAFS